MEPVFLALFMALGGGLGLKLMETMLGRKARQIEEKNKPQLPAKMTNHAIRHEEKMNFPDWPENWYTPCNCHICVPRTEGIKFQAQPILGNVITTPKAPEPKIKKIPKKEMEQIGRRLIIRDGAYRYEPVYGYKVYNRSRLQIEIADETGRIVKVIRDDEGLRTR